MKSRLQMIKSQWVSVTKSIHHPKKFLDLLGAFILSSYWIVNYLFCSILYWVTSLPIDELTQRPTDWSKDPPTKRTGKRPNGQPTDRPNCSSEQQLDLLTYYLLTKEITRNRATLIFHNDHFQVGTAFRVEGKFQYRSITSLKCPSIVVTCNSVQLGFDICACIGNIKLESTSIYYSQIHRDLSSWWSSENLKNANVFSFLSLEDKYFSRLQVTASL